MNKRIAAVGIVAALGVGAWGTSVSAQGAGGPSTGRDEAPAILSASPGGSTTVHRGADVPVNLNFKNASPFPHVNFGYLSNSGQHYAVRLQFNDGSNQHMPYGYNLVVPDSLPLGKSTLQTIEIDGFDSAVNNGGAYGVGVLNRNNQYVGIDPTIPGSDVPFERSYNIDLTKFDLTVK